MCGDELDLVQWIQQRAKRSTDVVLGIGDDMASVRSPGDSFLISSDMLLDSVHFDSREHTNDQIGHKAVGCVLSDCAAMAVLPVSLVISVALNARVSGDDVRALFEGMFSLAEKFDVVVVGGDTTSWEQPLVIDMVVTAKRGVSDPILRSGACVGDRLYVSGLLGGSLRGKHMNFTPRIHEAQQIAEQLGAHLHAMMDITDGLSLDLCRMVTSSGVGAKLYAHQLIDVTSEDAKLLSREDGVAVMDHVLSDGEDFELLASVSPDAVDVPDGWHQIGVVTESGLLLEHPDGRCDSLEPHGFIH